MSAVLSIAYLLSYVAAISAIVLYPKSAKKERALTWIPIAFFLLIAFDGFVAGVCTLLSIPVSLVSQMVGHLLLIAGVYATTRKKKQIQRIYITKRDIAFLVLFTLITLIVVRMEFGSDFTPHYLVTDAINHFRRSLRIYFDGTVSGMYQAWNFIASAIGVSSAFMRFDMFYKVYLTCDALLWYASGLLFYAAACEVLKREKTEIIAGIFCLLYTLGYPLNGLIWGFCYLGVGVSFSIAAIVFCKRILHENSLLYYFGLALTLFALVTSYALFAPFVYLVVFVCWSISFKRSNSLLSPRYFLLCLAVILIPGILGSWFFYDDILSAGTVTVTDALSNEGGMYRNLYSNLVLFAPLIIVGLWNFWRDRSLSTQPQATLFLVLCVSFAIMLIPAYYHALSTYYLGKMQFVIWPFALLLAAQGAQQAMNMTGKILLGGYSAVFAFLGIMVVGNVDQRVTEAYQPISVGTPAGYHPYLDVYQWNLNTMRTSGAISGDVWELCHEASNLVAEGEDVPAIAFGMYRGWYCDITCQLDDVRAIRVSPDNPEEVVDQIIDDDYQYVTVITIPYGGQGDDGAAAASNILLSEHNVELVFQNGAGYIARLLK